MCRPLAKAMHRGSTRARKAAVSPIRTSSPPWQLAFARSNASFTSPTKLVLTRFLQSRCDSSTRRERERERESVCVCVNVSVGECG